MPAIYLFSTFLFLFFFINNYSKFKCDTYCISRNFIIVSAMSFRLLFMILSKISYISFINCIIDLIIGYVIYKFASKYYEKNKALLYSAFYLLNPVVLIYSCSFKNIYSPLILSILCMFICLYNQKSIKALICFGISLFFSTNLFSFKYVSVNACNIWTMLGKNRSSIDNIYLGLPSKTLVIIVLILTLGTISYLNMRWKNNKNRYFILGFILIFITYLFQLGIHEEFFYMGIISLLLIFIVNGTKDSYKMYVGFSILHFFNIIYSLSIYDPNNFKPNDQ